MTSPICTVNGNTTGNGVNVAANSVVTIAIADTAGVRSWSLRCISTDENHVAATITAGLSIDQITKTATFTSPNVTTGAALIFESMVNGGLDVNGRQDSSLTTRFGVFVLTSTGGLRIGAFDETLEGDASFGWTSKFNAAVRAAGTAGVSPSITGTLPIVVNNSNPLAPVVSINAATGDAAGSMSAADKALVDTSTAVASGNAIARRDSSGVCAFNGVNTPYVYAEGGLLSLSADGTGTISLNGNTDAELHCPMPVNGGTFKLEADVVDRPIMIPLDWRSCKVGGVESWSISDVSDIVNDIQDPFANLSIECHFKNGMKIKSITFRHRGAGSGGNPLPGSPPSFSLYRKPISTGVASLVGTVNATLDGTFRGNFKDVTIDLSGSPHTVDNEAARYYLVVTCETGANAIAGAILRGITGVVTYPAGFSIGLG
jgi:hypothetical protein